MVQSQSSAPLTVAGLARAGGVGVETVRYYQRRGLLETPDRPENGIRRYGPDAVRRLRFVRAAQAAGFTLEQVAELIALDATHARARARALARARIGALEVEIVRLQAAKDALTRLARECGSGSVGPCPIITAFERS